MRATQRGFFRVPDFLEVRVFFLEFGNALQQVVETSLARVVAFLLERFNFHLLLNQASFQPVHRLRLGIHFHADTRSCFVDEVDGFVGQLPVGYVTVGQACRGDDRRIGYVDRVMQLIAFLQSPQDGDGILDARFVH